MNTILKALTMVAGCTLLCVSMYGFGYYHGYNDRTQINSSVALAEFELFSDNLAQNKLDVLRQNLNVLIYGTSHSLRELERSPFIHFAHEFSSCKAANIPTVLQKADKITSGIVIT